MRPPIRCPLVLLARSVGPCGACPCSTPATEGRVKCYQKWAVGRLLGRVASDVSSPGQSKVRLVTWPQFLIVVGGIVYFAFAVPRLILGRGRQVTRPRILITALGMAILGLLLIYVR